MILRWIRDGAADLHRSGLVHAPGSEPDDGRPYPVCPRVRSAHLELQLGIPRRPAGKKEGLPDRPAPLLSRHVRHGLREQLVGAVHLDNFGRPSRGHVRGRRRLHIGVPSSKEPREMAGTDDQHDAARWHGRTAPLPDRPLDARVDWLANRAGSGVVPSFLVFLARRVLPESVRFLITRGRIDQAATVVGRLEASAGPAYRYGGSPVVPPVAAKV